MALAADDVLRSLRGSWRLMTQGANAMKELDLSRDGFWRSFVALVLTLPALIAILAAERQMAGLTNVGNMFDSPLLIARILGAECLAVVAMPALLLGLAPSLAHSPRLTSFVIAWNWSGIVSASLMAVPATVFAIGWSKPSLAIAQAIAFAVIVLRLRYCVARAAFGAASGVAPLIVLASIIADYSIIRLFGLAGV